MGSFLHYPWLSLCLSSIFQYDFWRFWAAFFTILGCMYVCPPYFNMTFGGFVKLAIAPSVVSGNRTVRGQWQSHRPWSSAAENSPHSLNC